MYNNCAIKYDSIYDIIYTEGQSYSQVKPAQTCFEIPNIDQWQESLEGITYTLFL